MTPKRFFPVPVALLFLFVAGALISIAISVSIGAFVGSRGPSIRFGAMALASAVISAFVFGWSQFLLRKEGVSIAALGFPTNNRRIMELAAGFCITAALFLLLAYWQSSIVWASWDFQGWSGVAAAGVGLGLTACMVLAEELLFRGVGLRYLRVMLGDWQAITCSALAFGAYHIVGSKNWGVGLAFEFLTPALGGMLLGWACVRTGGIAFPLGLHWGGNWIQASVAGFTSAAEPTVSETAHSVWRIPVSDVDVGILMNPDLVPRLPYFVVIVVSAMFSVLFLRSTAPGTAARQ